MLKRPSAFVLLLTAVSCGGGNTTSPSPSPTPTPTATTFTLSGQVTDSTTGTPASGATLSIADGPNAGKAASTDSSGNYALTGLQPSGFTVNVSASNYVAQSRSVTLTSNQTLSFQLTRQTPQPTPSPTCTYTLSVGSNIDGYPNGGSFSVTVTTATGCTWTAVSNASWIQVPTPASGSGTGSFTFTVDANNSGTGRTGTVAAAGKIIAFNQTTQPPAPTPIPGLTSFMRNYIEAIFLGSGPLSPSDGNYACPTFAGTWTGFPRGTVVTVRVSTTVSTDKKQAIQNAAAQVATATRGAIQTAFTTTDDPNPIPGTNEATSTTHPSPSTQGCPSDNGCTIHSFVSNGVLRSSRAVQPANQTPNAYAHDIIGHGIMGMCHIDGNLIGGAGLSLMSGGPNVFSGQIALQLTASDIAAAQAVYDSGLNPGATKADFLRLGLINSSSNQTTTLFPLFKRAGHRD